MVTAKTDEGVKVGDIAVSTNNSTVWLYKMGFETMGERARLRGVHFATSSTMMRKRFVTTGKAGTESYRCEEAKDLTPRKIRSPIYFL